MRNPRTLAVLLVVVLLTALVALPLAAHPRTAGVDPEVERAIREAATEFGIDHGRFRRVLACESGLRANARNGQYLGLGQHGRGFRASQYPRFNQAVEPDQLGNPLSPFDNARVSAFVVAREGYRQWTCKG